MLIQIFGVTNKEHYGILWSFWSGQLDRRQLAVSYRLEEKKANQNRTKLNTHSVNMCKWATIQWLLDLILTPKIANNIL